MDYTEQQKQHFAALERDGESQTRIRLMRGDFGIKDALFADAIEFLRLKDEERSDRRASKAEFIARRANTIAIIAMIWSGITSIAAMSDKVILFLRWLGLIKP